MQMNMQADAKRIGVFTLAYGDRKAFDTLTDVVPEISADHLHTNINYPDRSHPNELEAKLLQSPQRLMDLVSVGAVLLRAGCDGLS